MIHWVSPEEEKEGYSGKDLQKTEGLEWTRGGVMDNDSGESMEPMEEVPLVRLGESELERLVRGWRREASVTEQHRLVPVSV